MQKHLYQDLYELEEKHWWHIAKRNAVFNFLKYNLISKNPKILDVGCGTGKNLEEFQRIGRSYGLDNSRDAINFCKKRGLKNLILGPIESTKLKSNYFNAITLLDVLEHVDDLKALSKLKKSLKKDGLLVITVPAFQWLWSKWDVELHHKRRYTKQSLTSVLNQAGFNVISISYMYSFLIFPVLIIRFFKSLLYKDYYPSDFKLSSPLLNYILDKTARIELALIKRSFVPIGLSLICVAKKNE